MIDSIEKVKKYYLDLDCSKFHMAREFPVSYKEYCSLGISKGYSGLKVKTQI